MRSNEPTQQHSSTNGSSPHSSPQTNGSSGKETNGFHRAPAEATTNGHSGAVAPRPQDTSPFYGHDREEVIRILLQSLSDLGYHGAAKHLSEESGYELEIPSAAAFRNAVTRGEWEEAEAILLGSDARELDGGGVMLGNGHARQPSWSKSRLSVGSQNGFSRTGLPLAEGADTTYLKFLLRQQKYLELLEVRDLNTALSVLRNELAPLKRDIARLHALSSLMMCPSTAELHAQANWDGAQGQSRDELLSEISKSISPSVMIPEHRLATLFTAVQDEQILNCLYHNTTAQPSLYTAHECSEEDFPLETLTELRGHNDEVWHLEFSHDGSMLATAGKDGRVCIYDTVRWKLQREFLEHERNANGAGDRGVCYLAFSPDDQYLISCAQNNEFVVVSVRDGKRVAVADHFDYPVTTAAWLPDSQTFVVGTQGSQRPLGLYSLRPQATGGGASSSAVVRNNELHTWRDPPWDPHNRDNPRSFRTSDCAVSPDGTRLVVATLDAKIMLYDLASRRKVGEWQMENKITSVCFDAAGDEMLVNVNEGRVLVVSAAANGATEGLGGPRAGEVVGRFDGVLQHEFVVRSCFGGAGQGFVVSGSEGALIPPPQSLPSFRLTSLTRCDSCEQTPASTSGADKPARRSPCSMATATAPSTPSPGTRPTRPSSPPPATTAGSGCTSSLSLFPLRPFPISLARC